MPDRFPPPWSSEEHSGYFVVRDRNGLALAYVYYGKNAAGRAAKLLSKDEPQRIAANIAKLPELSGVKRTLGEAASMSASDP